MDYIYELPPTDWFECFICEEDLDIDSSEIKKIIAKAKFLFARYTLWQGDGQCYVSSIPSEDSFPLTFVTIKQDDNGTTFLMSPIRLEYLSEYLVSRT